MTASSQSQDLQDSSVHMLAVRETAKRLAYDRYLSALLAPRDVQQDLVTLSAFVGEIARIPRTVTEPHLAEIRLQWWRDALDACQRGERTGNPVADNVGTLISRRGLPPVLFQAIIEGRSRELYRDGIATDAQLTSYCEETEGAPFRLAALLLGAEPQEEIDTITSHAAKAYGLVQLAVHLPYHIALGRVPLPEMEAARLRGQNLAQLRETLRDVSENLTNAAEENLTAFTNSIQTAPREIFAAFLPLSVIRLCISMLNEARRDPMLNPAEASQISRAVRIGIAYVRGKI